MNAGIHRSARNLNNYGMCAEKSTHFLHGSHVHYGSITLDQNSFDLLNRISFYYHKGIGTFDCTKCVWLYINNEWWEPFLYTITVTGSVRGNPQTLKPHVPRVCVGGFETVCLATRLGWLAIITLFNPISSYIVQDILKTSIFSSIIFLNSLFLQRSYILFNFHELLINSINVLRDHRDVSNKGKRVWSLRNVKALILNARLSMVFWGYTFTFRAFRRSYPKCLRISALQKKEKQYMAVGTARMFMEPSAKH